MTTMQGQSGPQKLVDGIPAIPRVGRYGDAMVSEFQGRFEEACYRGQLFSAGSKDTALSATSIGLTATSTPIVGVWNQAGSGKNLVILQAALAVTVAASSAVAPGGFYWAGSTGNTAISTGANPFNRLTFTTGGSVAKAFNGATALTGLTNNIAFVEGADFGTLIMAQGATGTPLIGVPQIQNFDGSLIVPPGGVLALLNVTSSTTVSVTSRLLWRETDI